MFECVSKAGEWNGKNKCMHINKDTNWFQPILDGREGQEMPVVIFLFFPVAVVTISQGCRGGGQLSMQDQSVVALEAPKLLSYDRNPNTLIRRLSPWPGEEVLG